MIRKIRAKVVGSLRTGYLTVTVGYDIGMMDGGYNTEIPADIVPPELRMPNSCLMLVMNSDSKRWVAAESYTDGPGIITNETNNDQVSAGVGQIYLFPRI